jgi:uncharacterized protein
MPSNRLAGEKSPYLLQHANNPVDWYPWGEAAFAKARAEDKPIFLSVGYSTCHWCHVMERESFENEEIAAVLNRDFVAIKVDREERPDVDRIYMLFVQATTGGGGWPMTVFLTPELKPFFGGTYFPPDNRYGRPGFGYLLEQITQAWGTQRDKILGSSASIVGELETHSQVTTGASRPDPNAAESVFAYLRRNFDSRYGGFGGAPKFPRPAVFHFLFRYYYRTQNPEALEMALVTLREMTKGGVNDHLGGGFHRYSVDERWFVPHFEKMLYDQAQLAVSYLEAFQITSDEQYAATACDILEYVLRDMTHPGGAFFSAEDADSVIDPAEPHEKGEGAFYVWKHAELEQVLGQEKAELFARHYGCEEDGNVANDPQGEFTGRNILHLAEALPEDAAMRAALQDARAKLLDARGLRPRPHLDDKILTSWNGLMISAFAKGAQILEATRPQAAQRYMGAGVAAARFVLDRLYDRGTGTLQRRWRDGEAAVDGFLDDYALFGQALLDLHQATLDPSWLELAKAVTAKMVELFEDREQGAFYSTTGAADLILRMKEDYDGAEPSGNSIAVLNLLRVAHYTGEDAFRATAERALNAFATRINDAGMTIPQMSAALLYSLAPKSQIVLAGEPREPFLRALRAKFRPFDAVLAGDERFPAREGKPTAYVCENFVCQAPTTDLDEFQALLR